MKKLLTTLFSVASILTANASTYTVSNNDVNPGQYTSITAAMSAAAAGDTLLIQGSAYNYGSITVSKSLVFIGAGHNPIDRQNTSATTLDDIVLGSAASAGSKFYGLNVNHIRLTDAAADNCLFSNCYIRYRCSYEVSGVSNTTFDGCIFANNGDIVINGNSNNVDVLKLQGCILNGRIYYFGPGSNYNYINYCTFFNKTNTSTFDNVRYFYVNNSLFIGANPVNGYGWVVFNKCASFKPMNGTADNTNPFSANSDGSAFNSFYGTNPLFTTYATLNTNADVAYFNYNHNYLLQSGSPYNTASLDGTQLGVYGNPNLSNTLIGYNQYGMPMSPYINQLNITGPTTISAGDSLQIYIKAKVRNN